MALTGYAVVFSSPSEDLGNFTEVIAPSAVDRTLREGIDLRALRAHDPDKLLGRMSAGTLTVAKDRKGLRVEIDAPAAPLGEETVELVRRGDLSSMSFAFQSLEDSWDDRGRLPVRTVVDARIREVSLVTWPAYQATEIGVRALRPRSLRPIQRPATVRGRLQEAMTYSLRSLEFATTKTSDGRAVTHDEARASLARFLDAKNAAGRRRPTERDGTPMVFRSTRAADGTWRGQWVSRHLSLDRALSRQLEVQRRIERERGLR